MWEPATAPVPGFQQEDQQEEDATAAGYDVHSEPGNSQSFLFIDESFVPPDDPFIMTSPHSIAAGKKHRRTSMHDGDDDYDDLAGNEMTYGGDDDDVADEYS